MSEHEETSTPAPPPGLPPETVVTAAAPSRRPAAYVAVVVGLLAMVGGAVFFARSLGGPAEGGADTPVAAVQRMFDAIGDEDAIGVLETLLPSERDELLTPIQDITRELSRLGILSTEIDLGSISGIELEFSDLVFTSEQLSNEVAAVTLSAGAVEYRVDPARSPLGDFVRGFLPPDADRVVEGSDTLQPGDEGIFTTIKDGDKWFVSLWYSVAESIRAESGAPLPPFGNGLPARGAATPEQAVEEFLRSAIGLDVRRLIELTPPVEARALHDYAPLFIDAAEAGVRDVAREFEAAIDTIELSSSVDGDRALVKVDEIAFRFEIPSLGLAVSYDGECVTVVGEFFGSDEPQRECGSGFAPAAGIPGLPTPEIGFATVREDGMWYVSPTRTVLDGLLETLKVLERSHLDMFARIFGGLTSG